MRLVLVWLINALSLLAVPYVLPSVSVASFYIALVTALVLGLLNTLIRPLLLLVTLPITILTLGLFTLVINGLLFWFVASIVEGFRVAGFWSAFWGAIVYSLISCVASWLLIPRPRLPPPEDYIDSTARRL
ncbi:MAG: phage holin family protein [Betaproteobacteria bacterium]|nr:MAG: phage holin family protein [Betaproteobacteria bacterium]